MELGEAVAARRRALKLHQSEVCGTLWPDEGILVRFERGQLTEFGSRKLLAALRCSRMEMSFVEVGKSGTTE